jgi:hypothetical protein
MSTAGFTLEQHNRAEVAEWLNQGGWMVACLCAAWCDTCCSYRASFDELAARHPDQRFVWIDIEDQADIVGDIDVENFPTLLIQRGDIVAFFGTVLPDARLAERLVQAQTEKSDVELSTEASASAEHRDWQRICNLRMRLSEAAQ